MQKYIFDFVVKLLLYSNRVLGGLLTQEEIVYIWKNMIFPLPPQVIVTLTWLNWCDSDVLNDKLLFRPWTVTFCCWWSYSIGKITTYLAFTSTLLALSYSITKKWFFLLPPASWALQHFSFSNGCKYFLYSLDCEPHQPNRTKSSQAFHVLSELL